MTRRPRRVERPRGAAAVEFAVVLPVLIAILCGTIDWGYYFFTREVVVNASREGARVGSLQFPGGAAEARTEAENAVRRYLGDASLDPLKATILTNAGPDGTGGGCPANASCVHITYDLGGAVTGFTGSFVPDSIVAYSQMRR